jgi:hypothetical protein
LFMLKFLLALNERNNTHMNLVNLFKSLEKKKSKQHLWLIISNVMFLKEVLMLKTFFPLNNCSFDFSANLYSPSSATVRQF